MLLLRGHFFNMTKKSHLTASWDSQIPRPLIVGDFESYSTHGLFALYTITQLCIPYHTFEHFHITFLEHGVWNQSMVYGFWRVVFEILKSQIPLSGIHTPLSDFIHHAQKLRNYILLLRNLDTPLYTHDMWKYLFQVAVLFETIQHSGCVLALYSFK